MNRKQSIVGDGKAKSALRNRATSAIAAPSATALGTAAPPPNRIVHCYLADCRVQRYASDGEHIKRLRLTVRSDAVFICSDRDETIQRVIPTTLITHVTYAPTCNRLRVAVSGEHDLLLTAARHADQEDHHVVEQEEPQPDSPNAFESARVFESASNQMEIVDDDDVVENGKRKVSRTIENIVEALDRALEQSHHEFFGLPQGGTTTASSSEEWAVEGQQDDALVSSTFGSDERSYRTFANYHVECVQPSRGAVQAGRVMEQRVRVMVNLQGAIDPKQCNLMKAMDYVSIGERLELRRRGSKKLLSSTRLTVEHWDNCVANPPTPVSRPLCLPEIVNKETVVMQGEIILNKVIKGLGMLSTPGEDIDTGSACSADPSRVVMLLIATTRRLVVMPSNASTMADVLCCCPMAAIHSLSVYANEWPPKRVDIRFLGANATPSVLDVTIASPSPPRSESAGGSSAMPSPQQQQTTTANVVIVAEFISRLAAREGVLVRMAQFKPPASDSATMRMQSSAARGSQSQTQAASGTIASAISSMFLPRSMQRLQSIPRSPQRSSSPGRFGAAQSIANTLAEGSDALRNVATSIFHSLSAPIPGNATASPSPTKNVHGGFDVALSVLHERSHGGITTPSAAFYAVPVTGRASSAVRHAVAAEAERTDRRGSFSKSLVGVSFDASFSSPTINTSGLATQPVATGSSLTVSTIHASKQQGKTATLATSSTIRRPLPATSGISDYCRPSVSIRHAFDDGGVRKVLLARYVARVASDEDIKRGEHHAPRILILSEHFNGADQRLTIADRRFVARAKLPYSALLRIEGFADDVLTLVFSAQRASNLLPEEQSVSFVLDDRKHHSLGDHPATRLADIISVMRQSIALTAEVHSHEYFSAYRSIAKSFLSKAMVAASSQAANALQRTSSHGSLKLAHLESDDGTAEYCDVEALVVPEQYTLSCDAFPSVEKVPSYVESSARSEGATQMCTASAAHGDKSAPPWNVAYCRHVQRLASNKTRWLSRMMAVFIPPTNDDDRGIACRPSHIGFILALFDDKGIVHRRVDGRSILKVNIVRDSSTSKRPQEPQGAILDFAIHGERRLVLRFAPEAPAGVTPSPLPKRAQKWEHNWHGAPPQVVRPLLDAMLPTAAMRAMQFINLLRRCCSFDFEESYDERKNWEEGVAAGDEANTTTAAGHWAFDPNEVVFMDRRASTMRIDYFSRTPVRSIPMGDSRTAADEVNDGAAIAGSAEVEITVDYEPFLIQVHLEEQSQRRQIICDALRTLESTTSAFEASLLELQDELQCQEDEIHWFGIALNRLEVEEIDARMSIESERIVYMATALEEVFYDSFSYEALGAWTLLEMERHACYHTVWGFEERAQSLCASKESLMQSSAALHKLVLNEERIRAGLEEVENIRRTTRLREASATWNDLCACDPLLQLAHFSNFAVNDHRALGPSLLASAALTSIAAFETLQRAIVEAASNCALSRIQLMCNEEYGNVVAVSMMTSFVLVCSSDLRMACCHYLAKLHSDNQEFISASSVASILQSRWTAASAVLFDAAARTLESKAQALSSETGLVHAASFCDSWVHKQERLHAFSLDCAESGRRCALEEQYHREHAEARWLSALQQKVSTSRCIRTLACEWSESRAVVLGEEFTARVSLVMDNAVAEKLLCFSEVSLFQREVFTQECHTNIPCLQIRLAEDQHRERLVSIEADTRGVAAAQLHFELMEMHSRAERHYCEAIALALMLEALGRERTAWEEKEAYRAVVATMLLQLKSQSVHDGAVRYVSVVDGDKLQRCVEPSLRAALYLDETHDRQQLCWLSTLHISTASQAQRVISEAEVGFSVIIAAEEEAFLALVDVLHVVWFSEGRQRTLVAQQRREQIAEIFDAHATELHMNWMHAVGVHLQRIRGTIRAEQNARLDQCTEEALEFAEVARRRALYYDESRCHIAFVGLLSTEGANVRMLAYRRRITQRRISLLHEEEEIERSVVEEGYDRGYRSLQMASHLLSMQLLICQNEEDMRVQLELIQHSEREWQYHQFLCATSWMYKTIDLLAEEACCRAILSSSATGEAAPVATLRGPFNVGVAALNVVQQLRYDETNAWRLLRRQCSDEHTAAFQRQVMADLRRGKTRYQQETVESPSRPSAVSVTHTPGMVAPPVAQVHSMPRGVPPPPVAVVASAPQPPPQHMIGAGAGAGASALTPPRQDQSRGPANVGTAAMPTHTSGTKIRIRSADSFLQVHVQSEELLARIVKRGRSEMKRSSPQGEDINQMTASQFTEVFPLSVFCHCQSDRFRDTLAIRPATFVDALSMSVSTSESRSVTVQVRTSHFHWVAIDWEHLASEWISKGVTPIMQADRALANNTKGMR